MNKYDYCTISVKLHKEKDREIIDYLDKCRSKTESIRQAILSQIKAESKEKED